MAGVPLATLLKALFLILGCVITATVVYTVATDGLPFRRELLTPWMAATLVDFYVNIFVLAVWISYKEANILSAVIWNVLLVCLGSIITCAYIFIQFLKLSPEESFQDPIYHILLRPGNKDAVVQKKKHFSIVTAKVIFTVLGLLMLVTLIYTLLTDGSPFRKELLTPWMNATLIDFYINVTALAVWVAYKESNWFGALVCIILLICFGSITTCVYIVGQLLQLTSQDSFYLILLNRGNRYELCSCGP